MLLKLKKIALLYVIAIALIFPCFSSKAKAEGMSRDAALQMFELPADATLEQIKAQFRKLSKKYHPDTGGSAEQFTQLQSAYEALSAPSRKATANDIVLFPHHRINIFYGLDGIPLKKEMERLTRIWDNSVGIHFDAAIAEAAGPNGKIRPNLNPEIFRGYIAAHRAFVDNQLIKPELSRLASVFNAEFIPLLKTENPSVDHLVAAFAKQLANMGESDLLASFLKGFELPGRVNDRDIKRYKELREFLLSEHPDSKVQSLLNEFTETLVKGDHNFAKRQGEYLDLARKGRISWEALVDRISRGKISPDLYNFADELMRNLNEQERNHVAHMQIHLNSNSASEVPAIRKALLEMSEKDLPWYNWGQGELFGQWKGGNRALLLELLAKFEKEEPGFLERKHAELKKLISKWRLNSEYSRGERLLEADRSYKKLKKELAAFKGEKLPPSKPSPRSCNDKFKALTP